MLGFPESKERYTGLKVRRMVQLARGFLPAILLAASLVSPPALDAGDKKKQPQQQYYLKPDQTADLHHPKLVTAKQNCANWGLAAGLETMLAQQKVALDQNFWVMRLNFGEVCAGMPSIEHLLKVVNREFVLDDGRHVLLELSFTPGAPTDVDSLLARLQRDQALLLLWRGHPYFLVGATYDERIGLDGTRFFEIKELRLADTFAKQPAVTFQKSRDDMSEIDGIVSVSVVPR